MDPNFEVTESDLLNEKEYQEWIKQRINDENNNFGNEKKFDVEDEIGLKTENDRGRTNSDQWKTNNKNNTWKKI